MDEQRFALSARGDPSSEAGLVRDEIGRVWLVLPDGSRQLLSGGGSQPAVYDTVNGIVKDYDPPGGIDNCGALLLDAAAQPWQANHEYSNAGDGLGSNPNNVNGAVGAYVTPTDNTNGVKFRAQENASAVTGSVEPTWSQDGATPVEDGTAARPLEWGPVGIYQLWAATTALVGVVIGNGYAWSSDGGGNSGGSEPAWPATPNSGATVTDGAITWTVVGPCVAWTSGTRRSFVLDAPTPTSGYNQFAVIPSAAVPDTDYVFLGQPIGVFGTTGGTEPDWGDAMPSDSSEWVDGDILWNEATSDTEAVVLNGIVAPAAPKALTILNGCDAAQGLLLTLEDTAEVDNNYGVYAESDPANVFDSADQNRDILRLQFLVAAYVHGHWQTSVSVT